MADRLPSAGNRLQRVARARPRLVIAVGLFLAYLLVMFPLGCGRMLADRLMLFPSRDAIRGHGAEERLLDTPVGRIHVLVARSGPAGDAVVSGQSAADVLAARTTLEPERFVVRFEGNASRAEFTAVELAHRWREEPTEVWAVNHPGFGKSDGPATLARLAPAALAVYDAAWEAAAGRPVYLDADSMGCTMALHVAAERAESRPPAGIVLKNPPPLRQIVLGRFGWWNLWLAAGPVAAGVPKELDAIANARRAKAPAVFICAENDTIVPVHYQRRVIDAYAGPKTVIDFRGAEHNTPLDETVETEIGTAIRNLAAEMAEETPAGAAGG